MSAPAHRLVTLVFSHYNEKARWALDCCGVDYVEDAYMPGFSQLAVMVATRGRGGSADKVSSRWSTPVLVTREGQTLCDSTEIARWASARIGAGGPGPLFPTAEVGELVEALGRDLGPYTRVIAYWHAFRTPSLLETLAERNLGRGQARAYRVVAPIVAPMIRRGLRVDEAGYLRAMDRVRAQMASVERRLDRGPYLIGDRFTAADLTFAALFAPVMLVNQDEGYGARLPVPDELAVDARALIAEMRASRVGAFVLSLYRRHRRERITAAA